MIVYDLHESWHKHRYNRSNLKNEKPHATLILFFCTLSKFEINPHLQNNCKLTPIFTTVLSRDDPFNNFISDLHFLFNYYQFLGLDFLFWIHCNNQDDWSSLLVTTGLKAGGGLGQGFKIYFHENYFTPVHLSLTGGIFSFHAPIC